MSDTTYARINHDNYSDGSSSYNFWTWLIAIIAAIYLLWAWQHDRTPFAGASCCTTSEVVDSGTVTTAPFSFSASSSEAFSANGDTSGISWINDSVALKDWLNGGADWKVIGDANHVTLTGTVDSEATKAAKGAEAQAFFGENVTIDNQLVVETVAIAEADPTPIAEPMAMNVPDAVKIYFDTGYHALPADGPNKLTGIVDWLKAHPESKAIISGFHDPRGDKAMNIALSKKRAESVYSYLVSVGIPTDNIEMRKPQNVEGDGDLSEARRAEVTIE